MTEERIRKIKNFFLPKKDKDYIYCFKMSKYVKVFTLSVLAFIFIFLIVLFLRNSISYLYWWIPIFILCVLLFAVISYPIAVYIDDKEIEIHAVLEVVSLKMTSIKRIHHLDRNYAKDYFIPIIATCGFLGHNGLYYDVLLRRWIKLCCVEKKNLVMIECVGKHFYVISTSDMTEKMIHLIAEKVKQNKKEIEATIEGFAEDKLHSH